MSVAPTLAQRFPRCSTGAKRATTPTARPRKTAPTGQRSTAISQCKTPPLSPSSRPETRTTKNAHPISTMTAIASATDSTKRSSVDRSSSHSMIALSASMTARIAPETCQIAYAAANAINPAELLREDLLDGGVERFVGRMRELRLDRRRDVLLPHVLMADGTQERDARGRSSEMKPMNARIAIAVAYTSRRCSWNASIQVRRKSRTVGTYPMR